MKFLTENQDLYKRVVTNYRGCGHKEYYGMLYWLNGMQLCRQCIYHEWQKETPWVPGDKDYVFPLYSDGVNYYEEK